MKSAGFQFSENKQTKVITAKKGSAVIQYKIGDPSVKVNGKTKKWTVAPQSIKSIGYIPASIVASALGLQVEWDPKLNEVRFGTPVELAKDAIKRF